MINTGLDKPGRLANKIAVITGSSSGIGRAIALAFASEGASIVCSDLREEAREEYASDALIQTTVQEALKLGAKAIFVKCDTSSSDNIQALIQKAVMEFGRVDIMVNNAGITLEMGDHDFRPVWEYEETVFEKTMDVNIKGVFLGIKYASKQMIVQEPGPNGDRGWIINLASVFGLNGGPGVGEFIFCSTTWVTLSVSLDEAIIFATGLFNTK
jgi:NAD(P)-dependent dehydrogenase (short-subunit alcohol dehydrogenase family)